MPRSLKVDQNHLGRVKLAVRRSGFLSQQALAEELGLARSTVVNFLTGKPVDRAVFEEICLKLSLDSQEVAEVDLELPVVEQIEGNQTNISQIAAGGVKRSRNLSGVPDSSICFGRTLELTTLKQWILQEHCRLVALLGVGGIGKTTLTAELIQNGLADPIPLEQGGFAGVIWRSLRYAPPVTVTLTELLRFVRPGSELIDTITLDQQISALLTHLCSQRYLIVLDDWESVLQEGEWAGYCAKEHQGYARLLQRLAKEPHQSCLLLLSREQPIEITSLINVDTVRLMKLKGLQLSDVRELLGTKVGAIEEVGLPELIQIHRGNPAAILRAAVTIQDLFEGSTTQFLAQTSLVLGDVVLNLLEQQFARLSELESAIVFWLGLVRKPMSIADLKAKMNWEERAHLLTALDSLRRRSLIEQTVSLAAEEAKITEAKAAFTLEPVVMKYVVQQLVSQISQDVCTVMQTQSVAQLGLLRSHLLLAEDGNQVQFYQSQRLLNRLCDRLRSQWGGDMEQIGTNLSAVLTWLQEKDSNSIGYAELNVTKLLEMIKAS